MAHTAELITDSTSAIREIGMDFSEVTLQSGIYLEGPRDRDPVLVKFPDGKYAILIRDVEYGNYLPHGRAYAIIQKHNIRVHTYEYYFTMPNLERRATAPKNDSVALKTNYDIDTVTVHADMPLGRYLRFRENFSVQITDLQKQTKEYHVYAVDKGYVVDAFCRIDAEDIALTMDMLRKRSHATAQDLDILNKYMEAERIDPFIILDGMLDKASCVLADTQLTTHTLTGMPWKEIEAGRDYSLYTDGKIYLISEKKLSKPFLFFEKTFSSLVEAVASLAPGKKITLEEKSIPVGVAMAFGIDVVKDITETLTLWRNRYSFQALPYFIINSLANIWSIETALEITREGLTAGHKMTERDIEKIFVSKLAEFLKEHGCEHLGIDKYFVVLHAGTRCLFPGLSTDYVLHKDMKTLKLDAGVALYRNGMRMSTSDLGRMLTLTEEITWLYDLLAKNIREEVIPNIKPDMSGEEIYWLGLKPLSKHEGDIKAKGLLPAALSLEKDYNRNIGHTIDKEESAAVLVQKGDSRKFESLWVGCIEYQWPYDGNAIAVEDMFFIAPEKTVNITY